MLAKMPARHFQVLRVGGERFLGLRMKDRWMVIADRCKHKGGPLSLGRWDPKTCSIVCPWHDQKNTPRELASQEVPWIRVGDSLRFLVSDEPDDH